MTDQRLRTKDSAAGADQGRGEAAVDMADLKRKSVRGGMVTMTSQGVSIVIQLALRVPCPSPVASRQSHEPLDVS